jgi:hypothetical protein
MNLGKLAGRGTRAIRSAVNDARRRRRHTLEGRGGHRQLSRKELEREIAIERERNRRSPGGL